jgi:Holliday junction resolvase RusA-like endonuclease
MSQAEDVVHGHLCACRAQRVGNGAFYVMGDNGTEAHTLQSCRRTMRVDRIGDTSLDIRFEPLAAIAMQVVLINGVVYDRRGLAHRMRWEVEPMGKVRMTQSDKWKVGEKARPCVARYRAYHDALRALGVTIEPGDEIHFHIQMPPSWSKKKRALHDGTPHRQKPDIDNLVGGLLDGVLEEDKGIDRLGETSKSWTAKPSSIIIIRRI